MLVVRVTSFGAKMGYAFSYFQLAMGLLSFLAFLPWLLSTTPIIPAIRLTSQKSYMTVMLSAHNSGFIKESISGVIVF
jgi:hypothetical protein